MTCYDPTTGAARLWIDPISEMDSYARATDALPGAVDFYSFQQTASGVSAQNDDLVVANSFEGALLSPPPPALQAVLVNGSLQISWPQKGSAGYTLYQNNYLAMLEWWPVTKPPTVQNDRIVVTIAPANRSRFYQLKREPVDN